MNKHNIKLIDGNFSHEKAKSILIELLDYKIGIHSAEKFSNNIRFGKDREHSQKRIKQLTDAKQGMTQWLESIQTTDKIKIKCNINIEIIK